MVVGGASFERSEWGSINQGFGVGIRRKQKLHQSPHPGIITGMRLDAHGCWQASDRSGPDMYSRLSKKSSALLLYIVTVLKPLFFWGVKESNNNLGNCCWVFAGFFMNLGGSLRVLKYPESAILWFRFFFFSNARTQWVFQFWLYLEPTVIKPNQRPPRVSTYKWNL